MNDALIQTLTAVVVSFAFCLLYFAGSTFVLDRVVDAAQRITQAAAPLTEVGKALDDVATAAGAAHDAGREARIVRRLAGAADHPVALNFPEGEYLKGLLVQVD